MAKKTRKRRPTSRQQATRTQGASRREQRALARKQKQQKQRLIVALIAVAAVAIVAFLIWLNNQPLSLITVAAQVPASANGAAWGPPGAPVIIEDWSDFG